MLLWPSSRATAADPGRADFARDVRPILERACWKCHGPEEQKGGLRLDLRATALGGGDSGERTITPGKADESELIRRVEAEDVEERMQPKSDPLGRDEVRVLRAWIDQGADWPEAAVTTSNGRRAMAVTAEDRRHWSYRPLGPVDTPGVRDAAWCRTTIDRFVFAALEANGIRPNALAGRRTLVRRVYFDLIGLPLPPRLLGWVFNQFLTQGSG